MQFEIIKFFFNTSVHFGNDKLDDSNITVYADTLFSALYIEALKISLDTANTLYTAVSTGKLIFSDAFPFYEDILFLPKPIKKIDKEAKDGDSVVKKAYKKLQYIPSNQFTEYLRGQFDVINDQTPQFGVNYMKVQAAIRGESETVPYRVGCFKFNNESGLYIIACYESGVEKDIMHKLIDSLSFTGIGGEKSSGMGKFDYSFEEADRKLIDRLSKDSEEYMLLSVSLPDDDELESVLEESTYIICRRSGFIASTEFSDMYIKKEDRYMFKSGSCFKKKYSGTVMDVSGGRGRHPVYRYGKGMFIGVNV